MEFIKIKSRKKLKGTISIDGAKNSVLPILAATVLTTEKCTLDNVPGIIDVEDMLLILEDFGAVVEKNYPSISVQMKNIEHTEANKQLVKKLRASSILMGSMLARTGEITIPYPGGDEIGTRPLDLHIKGFKLLGAKVTEKDGILTIKGDKLKGNSIYLDYPSVGATQNIILASILAEGETIIDNAAQEPEIIDLANFISGLGGKIYGAGTNSIRIKGVKKLGGTVHNIIPDRIQAGTYMIAAAMCADEIKITDLIPSHNKAIIAKLKEAGVDIKVGDDYVVVKGADSIKPLNITTLPYPGFPTDLQAQIMAFLSIAQGTSYIYETVYENRFMHVASLNKMGAQIHIEGRKAKIIGVKGLEGSFENATDIRAGAALILAGLIAEGDTTIGEVYHIHRGYEDIIGQLQNLGADIDYCTI